MRVKPGQKYKDEYPSFTWRDRGIVQRILQPYKYPDTHTTFEAKSVDQNCENATTASQRRDQKKNLGLGKATEFDDDEWSRQKPSGAKSSKEMRKKGPGGSVSTLKRRLMNC